MKVVGITGGIASGKSTVLAMLRELGAQVIDTDPIVHQLMKSSSPLFKFIVNRFGKGILDGAGEIDRGRLGQIAFTDPSALAYLEGVLHPSVYQEVKEWLADTKARLGPSSRQRVYVVDGAKVHRDLLPRCDSLWVVYTPEHLQLERLMKDRGLTEDQARQRIAAQVPWEERLRQADVVIDNSGTIEETRNQVEKEWERLLLSPCTE